MIAIMIIGFIFWVGWLWFSISSTARRRCECSSFTPNPHDGDCAVCRGYEP